MELCCAENLDRFGLGNPEINAHLVEVEAQKREKDNLKPTSATWLHCQRPISLCYEGLDTMRRWQQAQQHLVWEGQCQQLPRASLCQLLYRALCSCHILPRNWNGITRQKEKRSRLVSFRIQWRLFPCYQHTTSFLHTRRERKEPAERSLHTKLWLYLWIGKFRIISDYLFSKNECRFQQGVHWFRRPRGRIDPDFLHSNVPYY